MIQTKSLTSIETQRRTACEAVIEKGLATFIDVGNAFAEILDSRLYRQTHDTFEEYCWERWGIKKSHAYRLIAAADVADNLSPIGDIQPTAESQVRPLVGMEPEQQRTVYKAAHEKAVANGKSHPTAKDVEAAVEEIHPTDKAIFQDNSAKGKKQRERAEERRLEKEAEEEDRAISLSLMDAIITLEPWEDASVEEQAEYIVDTVSGEHLKLVFDRKVTADRLRKCAEVSLAVAEQWRVAIVLSLLLATTQAGRSYVWTEDIPAITQNFANEARNFGQYVQMGENQLTQIQQFTTQIQNQVETLRRFGDPRTYVDMLGLNQLLESALQIKQGVGQTISEVRQTASGVQALGYSGARIVQRQIYETGTGKKRERS